MYNFDYFSSVKSPPPVSSHPIKSNINISYKYSYYLLVKIFILIIFSNSDKVFSFHTLVNLFSLSNIDS